MGQIWFLRAPRNNQLSLALVPNSNLGPWLKLVRNICGFLMVSMNFSIWYLPHILICDNLSIDYMDANLVFHAQTKHMDLNYHFFFVSGWSLAITRSSLFLQLINLQMFSIRVQIHAFLYLVKTFWLCKGIFGLRRLNVIFGYVLVIQKTNISKNVVGLNFSISSRLNLSILS